MHSRTKSSYIFMYFILTHIVLKQFYKIPEWSQGQQWQGKNINKIGRGIIVSRDPPSLCGLHQSYMHKRKLNWTILYKK